MNCNDIESVALQYTITQPFQHGINQFSSQFQQHLSARYRHNSIVIESDMPLKVISSAVWNGGLHTAQAFVNYRVPLHYESNDPINDMLELIAHEKLSEDSTVGLMTAAKLSDAVIGEWHQQDYSLLVLVTSGTSNAARAGMSRQTYPAYHAGTINIFVIIDGRLSESAIINSLITATEAKCAALADYGITEQTNGLIATGTTTDALVIASSQQQCYIQEHLYAGTATEIGCQLAELVYNSVYKAVSSQHEQ
ncbi:adenosylcobinamide amidohydrolase [Paenibacillus endoradicis]|uniref:adenosylcobinamide amidohydrolase n=1 Tax=Paenibacillus endoradicis TaxID=2972487 RepID=UPI00215932A2|nr:adenosylcobinamide amidohydrolase [Paenibacillus endoradicis]MCR8656378.1 adenosylcobinamide amidohydrolase [Paenibacillus endoradicis]